LSRTIRLDIVPMRDIVKLRRSGSSEFRALISRLTELGSGLPARVDSGFGCSNTSTGRRGCGCCSFSAVCLMRSRARFSSSVNSIAPVPKVGRLDPFVLELGADAIPLPNAGRLPNPPPNEGVFCVCPPQPFVVVEDDWKSCEL
jgi:hypothetical protein